MQLGGSGLGAGWWPTGPWVTQGASHCPPALQQFACEACTGWLCLASVDTQPWHMLASRCHREKDTPQSPAAPGGWPAPGITFTWAANSKP